MKSFFSRRTSKKTPDKGPAISEDVEYAGGGTVRPPSIAQDSFFAQSERQPTNESYDSFATGSVMSAPRISVNNPHDFVETVPVSPVESANSTRNPNSTGSTMSADGICVHETVFEALDRLDENSEGMVINFEKGLYIVSKMAEGGAATIHAARLLDAQIGHRYNVKSDELVVVKVLKEPPNVHRSKIQAAFEQEVSIMWILAKHRNFVKIFGYCRSPMVVVNKMYKMGSLSNLIYRSNADFTISDKDWTSQLQLGFCHDIANALKDMHELGIVHNDIKPANVLLDKDEATGNLLCVLCDYGIATVVSNPVLGVRTIGNSTARGASAMYAAPEVFKRLKTGQGVSNPELIKASDIFAFAIVIVEVLTRSAPWGTLKGNAELENAITSGQRPELNNHVLQKKSTDPIINFLFSTMEICWAGDPALRPDASTLFKTFEMFQGSISS